MFEGQDPKGPDTDDSNILQRMKMHYVNSPLSDLYDCIKNQKKVKNEIDPVAKQIKQEVIDESYEIAYKTKTVRNTRNRKKLSKTGDIKQSITSANNKQKSNEVIVEPENSIRDTTNTRNNVRNSASNETDYMKVAQDLPLRFRTGSQKKHLLEQIFSPEGKVNKNEIDPVAKQIKQEVIDESYEIAYKTKTNGIDPIAKLIKQEVIDESYETASETKTSNETDYMKVAQDLPLRFRTCSQKKHLLEQIFSPEGKLNNEMNESPPIIYITSDCVFQETGTNKIEIEFPFVQLELQMNVSVVKRVTPTDLIATKPIPSVNKAIDLLKKKFEGKVCVFINYIYINPDENAVICNLGRSQLCSHPEVFDLSHFLNKKQYFLQWHCPVC